MFQNKKNRKGAGFTLVELERSKSVRRNKGFTLIELLVVIAIIGLLASIVLVSLGGARNKARDARRVSDIRQISLAMEMCLDDASTDCGGASGNYPAIAAGAPGRLTTTRIGSVASPYLNPLPQDPGGGSAIVCTGTAEMTAGAYCGWTSLQTENYCIYTKLNDGRVFVASEKGTQFMGSAPTSREACP